MVNGSTGSKVMCKRLTSISHLLGHVLYQALIQRYIKEGYWLGFKVESFIYYEHYHSNRI